MAIPVWQLADINPSGSLIKDPEIMSRCFNVPIELLLRVYSFGSTYRFAHYVKGLMCVYTIDWLHAIVYHITCIIPFLLHYE